MNFLETISYFTNISDFRTYVTQISLFFVAFLASLDFHSLQATVWRIKKIIKESPTRQVYFWPREAKNKLRILIPRRSKTYCRNKYECTQWMIYTDKDRGMYIIINKQWRQVSMKTSLRFQVSSWLLVIF